MRGWDLFFIRTFNVEKSYHFDTSCIIEIETSWGSPKGLRGAKR